MILTEQNKNSAERNQSLNETRTFAVQPHTAEALRNRINQANSQAQRNTAVRNQSGQRPLNQNQQPVQNRPRPVNSDGERQTVRNPVPQRPSVQNPVPQKPAVQTPVNRMPAQARQPVTYDKPAPSPAKNNLASRGAEAAEKTVKQTAPKPRPAASASSTAPKQTMMKTRTVETVKKQKMIEYDGSDEGGNTVVSVVKAIVYIVFVMIVSVFLALVVINVGNDMFAFVKSDELVEVTIPEYATLDEITDVLYKNDIIRYPTIFKLFAVSEEDDRKFVAGTYTVHGMMNYEDLLDAFKEKPVTGIKKITIPEGYTTDEIIDLFVSEGIGTREGFVDVIQNYEFDYWFIDELNINGVNEDRIYRLDGYLFPDTYEFYLSSSEATVVNKLLKRFSQIFTKEYREQSAAFGYTVDEVITLASIIEKEAASPSEFFLVSSVFHNRLNNPWTFPKLESDATIVYQMQHESGERPQLTGADLEVDLAYNTYTNDGLPPGPIANPSASAMLAALSPQTTNYYFFYAYKGITYFSETKAQHEAYIAEFASATEQQTTGDLAAE